MRGGNGATPCGTLAIDKQGNLYGTTLQGGQPSNKIYPSFPYNIGTVFKIAVGTKTITTLARFDGIAVRGFFPEGLTLDKKGNLYGTTPFQQFGSGTLFKIATDTNTFTSLVEFDFKADEHTPVGKRKSTTFAFLEGMVCPGVAVDKAGNLYGTVASSNTYPYGFVYEIKAVTKTPAILATFSGPDGWHPNGYLALDINGNLYGTTREGGEQAKGTVFAIKSGSHQVVTLASFDGKNGCFPETGVIIDSVGNLYGTTRSSTAVSDAESSPVPSFPLADRRGGSNTGTVFKIAAGTKTIMTLARFDGVLNAFPKAGLTIDHKGNIYGATNKGGPSDNGTVFKLTPRN